MNIVFFGSSLVSTYRNKPATYYRGITRALHACGHHITFYEPDTCERQPHRDIPDPDWARVVVFPGEGMEGISRAVDEARSADLVIKAGEIGVFDAWLEEAVLELQGPGTLAAFWDVDAPATLAQLQANPTDPLRRYITRYDLVLTSGGGPPVVRAYREMGARSCVPICNGLDPATHHPAPPVHRFTADLGFLGNRMPDREARANEFLFRTAGMLPERRFILGGSGWEDRWLPPNIRYLGHVNTNDHNAFHGSVRMALNITRESMARCGFSPTARLFEAAGAGACLVTDDWMGLETFFEPGREILVARSGEEMTAHLRAVTPVRAREIGKAAFHRARAEHTYEHRVRQLLTILDERPSAPAKAA